MDKNIYNNKHFYPINSDLKSDIIDNRGPLPIWSAISINPLPTWIS